MRTPAIGGVVRKRTRCPTAARDQTGFVAGERPDLFLFHTDPVSGFRLFGNHWF
ncbi:hypothetical protein [Azospirillum argentinense]